MIQPLNLTGLDAHQIDHYISRLQPRTRLFHFGLLKIVFDNHCYPHLFVCHGDLPYLSIKSNAYSPVVVADFGVGCTSLPAVSMGYCDSALHSVIEPSYKRTLG